MWKESSGKYQRVFSQSLCLYGGMLRDKSNPKEVWNQRKIRCWSSALSWNWGIFPPSALRLPFKFDGYQGGASARVRKYQGACYVTGSASSRPQTPACRCDSPRDWCLNPRLSRRHGSARLQHEKACPRFWIRHMWWTLAPPDWDIKIHGKREMDQQVISNLIKHEKSGVTLFPGYF